MRGGAGAGGARAGCCRGTAQRGIRRTIHDVSDRRRGSAGLARHAVRRRRRAGVAGGVRRARRHRTRSAGDRRASAVVFWAVALWRRMAGSGLFVARLFSVLCGLVALAAVAAIAQRAAVPPALAMLLTIGCYGFAYTSAVARGFAPAQALTLWGVVMLLAARRGRCRWVIGGMLLGAATFANYLAVFVAVGALAVAAVMSARREFDQRMVCAGRPFVMAGRQDKRDAEKDTPLPLWAWAAKRTKVGGGVGRRVAPTNPSPNLGPLRGRKGRGSAYSSVRRFSALRPLIGAPQGSARPGHGAWHVRLSPDSCLPIFGFSLPSAAVA